MTDISVIAQNIEKWMKNRVHNAGAKGAVFGLSGGLDSAVVAALCKRAFGNNALGVIMPCHGVDEEVFHAELVAKTYELPYYTVDLSNGFNVLTKEFAANLTEPRQVSDAALTNLKPRLRMATLYYYAACYNYLVMGTGNRSEIAIGYFTKYGDGGVDLEPIGGLLKEEVKELAVYLKVPQAVITKAPSAGLWEGQTDEKELGFSYFELDLFLKHGEASQELKSKIELLQSKSEHKRQLPPMPEMLGGSCKR